MDRVLGFGPSDASSTLARGTEARPVRRRGAQSNDRASPGESIKGFDPAPNLFWCGASPSGGIRFFRLFKNAKMKRVEF